MRCCRYWVGALKRTEEYVHIWITDIPSDVLEEDIDRAVIISPNITSRSLSEDL